MDGLRGDAALWEILTSFPNLRELAELACRREGFTNGDRGAGVVYHREIEELAGFDDMAEGDNIPVGHVQVFTGWGPPRGCEVVVPESKYLETLASVLAWAGLGAEAERVRSLPREGSA